MADCNYDINNKLVCKYNPVGLKTNNSSENKLNEDFENKKIKSRRLSYIEPITKKDNSIIEILFGMKNTIYKLIYTKNLNKEFLYEDQNMFHIGVFLLICVIIIQYIRIFI